MTTSKITLSERIGLSHIDCYPVWNKDLTAIVLFDMYLKPGMVWIGSKRLLRYCEEVNAFYASKTKV